MRDLEALYEGDELFEKRVTRFLPQWEQETVTRYELRKKTAFYRNYLGAIIDYFAALLFTSKPNVVARDDKSQEVNPAPGDFYSAFREDCDRTGTDLDAFFKDRLTDAMVHRTSWLSVEQPVPGEGEAPPANRAEFDSRKLGECWLRPLSFDQVLDWESDDQGRLAWAIVHSCDSRRAEISDKRNRVTVTWEHYLPDRVDSYALTYEKDRPPPPETSVPLVGTRDHGFDQVPLVCIDLPRGLWAASRLKTPQLSHFRASNAQSWSLATSCYAMMIFNVESPEEFVKATVGAGRGIVLGPTEKAGWEAPPSAHFAALDDNIAAQKDEIFRLAHQMALGVENNAAAIGRTAESKSEDAQSTRVILLAYARVVKETIERVYDMLEALRGDHFKWAVEGLDDFASADLIGLVDTMVKVQTFGSIPSRTFRVQMFNKLAEGLLPDMDQATKAKVQTEIEAGTTDPAVDAAAERAAAAALFAPPTGAERPGQPAASPATRQNRDSRGAAVGQNNPRQQA